MLRRALGDSGLITSRDDGYALAVEPFAVDALAVMGNAATASRLLNVGEDQAAADMCASTLGLQRQFAPRLMS